MFGAFGSKHTLIDFGLPKISFSSEIQTEHVSELDTLEVIDLKKRVQERESPIFENIFLKSWL